MKILPDLIVFEWDQGNSEKNYKKHKVTQREAEEAVTSDNMFIFDDEKHSRLEKRYMIWGTTDGSRRLSVIVTIRNDIVRIISARDMNAKERRAYEEKIKTNPTI
ncbi:BrnT family toxin [Candidatus Gottesmanbacteria bacterium]|nr:BrnT family toxin [Candidatus Gottesmanbacteria bacterium]